MVVYPGHPLVGRIVPVVRRYGQRGEGQWVIELPDGSRQYVPAAWCSPLSSSRETLTVPAPPPDGPPPPGAAPSPLSLAALRDLAALVRRLREAAGQRGEEQDDAGLRGTNKRGSMAGTSGRERGAASSGAERNADAAELGELPAGGSAAAGQGDPPAARRQVEARSAGRLAKT